ncbi:Protein-L-isoaspartate O-methyltransferase [Diplonema papillatum]|nr:Protein-L-isoaspartate O-methyltransferase [Diplonema papillatum]
MSWRCSGRSNAELVENMFRAELIRSPRVKATLLRIDRGNYVRPGTDAYADSPQPIGCSLGAAHARRVPRAARALPTSAAAAGTRKVM